MDPSDWIVIANAAHARIFRRRADGSMVALAAFEHPESRRRSSVLGDAKAGRELSDRGFGGAAYEPRLSPQRKEQLHFAQQLAAHLEAAAREGSCKSVQLLASSPFLGELKQSLGPAAQRLLAGTREVDLTHVGVAEIEGRVRQELAQAG